MRRFRTRIMAAWCLALLIAVSFVGRPKTATALTDPEFNYWSESERGDFPISDVVHGDGTWVAVGSKNAVMSSTDGTTWHKRVSGYPWASVDFTGVAYGKNKFVAVGENAIMTSTDGAKWSPQMLSSDHFNTTPTWSYHFLDIKFGNNQFVAPARKCLWEQCEKNWSRTYSLVVWTSEDAEHWTEHVVIDKVYASPRPVAFAYGNGHFMIAAARDYLDVYAMIVTDAEFYTSSDGKTWSKHVEKDFNPCDLEYGNGRFVAVSGFGMLVSTDHGITWNYVKYLQGSYSETLDGNSVKVSFGNGQFITTGETFNDKGRYPYVLMSTDGLVWTKHVQPVVLYALGFGNGMWVGIKYDRAPYSSIDGVDWSKAGTVVKQQQRMVDPTLSSLKATRRFLSADGTSTVKLHLTLRDTRGQSVVGEEFGFYIRTSVSDEPKLRWWPDYFVTDESGQAEVTMVADAPGDFQIRAHSSSLNGVVLDGEIGLHFLDTKEGIVVPCYDRFSDVPADHLACASLELLSTRGITGGYSDKTFRPDNPITRAEVAKLLVLALGLEPNTSTDLAFSDARGHWAEQAGYLQTAVKIGAFGGFADGTLRPDDLVTRAQLTKITAAALSLGQSPTTEYADTKGQWYEGWASMAWRAGLIGPKADTPIWMEKQLHGDKPATRSEAAILIANMLDIKTRWRR